MKLLEMLGLVDTKEKRQKRYFKAIEDNKTEKVRELIAAGIDIYSMQNGETGLTLAASKGNLEIIDLLLNIGTPIDQTNSCGKTALIIASEKGNNNLATYLILKKASVYICDDKGNSPLIMASSKGQIHLVCYLLNYSENILNKNDNGYTAYSCAATPKIKKLIKNKMNFCLLSEASCSASDYESAGKIESLLEAGADVNVINNSGNNAFTLAASRNKTETMQILIDNGADINSKDKNGHTALILAVQHDSRDAVHKLLKNGADIKVASQDGTTALNCTSHKSKNTILHQLIGKIDFSTIQKLIELGADINARNLEGRTPLHIAASNRDFDTINLLMERGADITATDNVRNTPYILAQNTLNYWEHDNTCTILIRQHLDELLIDAIQREQVERVHTLIRSGADVNTTDKSKLTAVSIAATKGNKQILRTLISNGANIHGKNYSGSNALPYAKDKEIEQFMIEMIMEPYNRKATMDIQKLKNAETPNAICELEISARLDYQYSKENSLERAYAAEYLAATLRYQDKFDEALKYYNEALQNKDYSDTVGNYIVKGIIHRGPRRDYVQIKINNINAKKDLLKNTFVKDVIMAPQLYEEYTGDNNTKHILRINNLRNFIKTTGSLPSGDKLCLTMTRDNTFLRELKLQVLDGNHRLIALALQNPNAKISDVSKQLIKVHTKKTVKMFQHFHVYTNFAEGIETEEVESNDGAVKRLYSGPVYFRDSSVFRAPGMLYGFFGQTVGKTAEDMRI